MGHQSFLLLLQKKEIILVSCSVLQVHGEDSRGWWFFELFKDAIDHEDQHDNTMSEGFRQTLPGSAVFPRFSEKCFTFFYVMTKAAGDCCPICSKVPGMKQKERVWAFAGGESGSLSSEITRSWGHGGVWCVTAWEGLSCSLSEQRNPHAEVQSQSGDCLPNFALHFLLVTSDELIELVLGQIRILILQKLREWFPLAREEHIQNHKCKIQ